MTCSWAEEEEEELVGVGGMGGWGGSVRAFTGHDVNSTGVRIRNFGSGAFALQAVVAFFVVYISAKVFLKYKIRLDDNDCHCGVDGPRPSNARPRPSVSLRAAASASSND